MTSTLPTAVYAVRVQTVTGVYFRRRYLFCTVTVVIPIERESHFALSTDGTKEVNSRQYSIKSTGTYVVLAVLLQLYTPHTIDA